MLVLNALNYICLAYHIDSTGCKNIDNTIFDFFNFQFLVVKAMIFTKFNQEVCFLVKKLTEIQRFE